MVPNEAEPDVTCTTPSILKDDANTITGRTEEGCCHVTGMCSGNTVVSENVTCTSGILKITENINITSDNSEDDCCDHTQIVVHYQK